LGRSILIKDFSPVTSIYIEPVYSCHGDFGELLHIILFKELISGSNDPLNIVNRRIVSFKGNLNNCLPGLACHPDLFLFASPVSISIID
jgi:hypothetical protein